MTDTEYDYLKSDSCQAGLKAYRDASEGDLIPTGESELFHIGWQMGVDEDFQEAVSKLWVFAKSL